MRNLYKIFFLSLLILSVSCKSKLYVGELEKRNGSYHYKGKPYSGYFFSTYSDGNIFEEGELKDGYKVGKSTTYYKNKQIKEEEFNILVVWDNGEHHNYFDGTRKEFYENGQLKSIENYNNGPKEGLFETYDEYGNILSSYIYHNDERHGDFSEVYSDDEPGRYDIKIVGKYNMGKLNGEFIRYYKSKIQTKIMYDNGVIKFEENYDKNGKLIR